MGHWTGCEGWPRRLGLCLLSALTCLLVSTAAKAGQEDLPPAPPAPPLQTESSVLSAEKPATHASKYLYGTGVRLRWVSVPSWLLGLFTKENVPLSSYSVGGEFIIRQPDTDIVIGLTYQKMGPPDGNWLGRGKQASIDTDFISFRNFGFVGADVAFVQKRQVNEYLGFRFGAGLGVAIMTGKMLRVSNSGCTEQNVGDTRVCKPVYCPAEGCTEAMHIAKEGRPDGGPTDPHRFSDPNIPGAIPIINFVGGMDFRIPDVKGLEFRLETGFFNAFFVGLGTGYQF
jgi:hypothetical protein